MLRLTLVTPLFLLLALALLLPASHASTVAAVAKDKRYSAQQQQQLRGLTA